MISEDTPLWVILNLHPNPHFLSQNLIAANIQASKQNRQRMYQRKVFAIALLFVVAAANGYGDGGSIVNGNVRGGGGSMAVGKAQENVGAVGLHGVAALGDEAESKVRFQQSYQKLEL